MPLGFARQFLSGPTGIGRGLVVAHVYGPIERQWSFLEHRPAGPRIASTHPKYWVLPALGFDALPTCFAPQRAIAVSSFKHEAQILLIRHVVCIDGEGGDVHAMFLKFVVPAKSSVLPPPHAQRRYSCRDCDFDRNAWLSCWRRQNRAAEFALDRQLVQHVAQRFGVHQAMFDGDIEQAAMFEALQAGVFRSGRPQRVVQRAAQSGRVAPYFFWRWPIFREVIRQTSLHGIDAEGEESIEIGIERSKSEWLKEKVPIECLQMTQIENNTVALGNGTVVEGFGPDNFKQFVTVGSCLADSRMQPFKVGLRNCRGVHTYTPGQK